LFLATHQDQRDDVIASLFFIHHDGELLNNILFDERKITILWRETCKKSSSQFVGSTRKNIRKNPRIYVPS
jgi:hypothetical protein